MKNLRQRSLNVHTVSGQFKVEWFGELEIYLYNQQGEKIPTLLISVAYIKGSNLIVSEEQLHENQAIVDRTKQLVVTRAHEHPFIVEKRHRLLPYEIVNKIVNNSNGATTINYPSLHPIGANANNAYFYNKILHARYGHQFNIGSYGATCDICAKNKAKRQPHPPVKEKVMKDRLHLDSCYIDKEGLHNERGFVVGKHEETGFMFAVPYKNKYGIPGIVKEIVTIAKPQSVRTDNGSEYCNNGKGFFELKHVRSAENYADILTKSVKSIANLKKFCAAVGLSVT